MQPFRDKAYYAALVPFHMLQATALRYTLSSSGFPSEKGRSVPISAERLRQLNDSATLPRPGGRSRSGPGLRQYLRMARQSYSNNTKTYDYYRFLIFVKMS